MAVNKVILIGNVGKDPDVRYIDNDLAVANFTLATTERGYTGRDGKVIPERTEWHNIVVWRGLAKVVEQYVRKGSQIYVEGKIRTRSYDDKENNKRYITEIFVDSLQLLGRKGDSPAPTPLTPTMPQTAQATGSAVSQSTGVDSAIYGTPPQPMNPPTEDYFGSGSGDDDDLPF